MQSVWVSSRQRGKKPRIRLFCLPYAGGGTLIFHSWAKVLPADIEICPIQLPGRECRVRERFITNMVTMVDALVSALQNHLDAPFALFGHSMGAIIAYETARRLLATHAKTPWVLLVSGARAPHLVPLRSPIHSLEDGAFIEEIRKLNGTLPEVLEHAELMQLLIPLLRGDFKLVETYRELDGPKLACPVVAFGGREDDQVPPASIEAWREKTSGPFIRYLLPGGHFFVNSAREQLLGLIAAALRHPPL
ncbi:MAG: alpha/beta fold hydrolase [Candidatus Competibacteraceae bacterium]